MGKRMDLILGDEDYATLVACDDEQIVGFIGTRGGLFYESDGQYGQTTVTREQVVSVLETAKDIVRSASNTTLQPTNGAFRFGCSQSGSRAARG
jgi:hypothetical protein